MKANKLKTLILELETISAKKFKDATLEKDDSGKRLIEHGALCYFNIAQKLKALTRPRKAALKINLAATPAHRSNLHVDYP